MSEHAEKAAEHAEHAGRDLAASDNLRERLGGTSTPADLLARAQVEATLSVAQRLADLGEAIDNHG